MAWGQLAVEFGGDGGDGHVCGGFGGEACGWLDVSESGNVMGNVAWPFFAVFLRLGTANFVVERASVTYGLAVLIGGQIGEVIPEWLQGYIRSKNIFYILELPVEIDIPVGRQDVNTNYKDHPIIQMHIPIAYSIRRSDAQFGVLFPCSRSKASSNTSFPDIITQTNRSSFIGVLLLHSLEVPTAFFIAFNPYIRGAYKSPFTFASPSTL